MCLKCASVCASPAHAHPEALAAKEKDQLIEELVFRFMVGVTRFELVASSVSGKRSPPELNALAQCFRFRVSNQLV